MASQPSNLESSRTASSSGNVVSESSSDLNDVNSARQITSSPSSTSRATEELDQSSSNLFMNRLLNVVRYLNRFRSNSDPNRSQASSSNTSDDSRNLSSNSNEIHLIGENIRSRLEIDQIIQQLNDEFNRNRSIYSSNVRNLSSFDPILVIGNNINRANSTSNVVVDRIYTTLSERLNSNSARTEQNDEIVSENSSQSSRPVTSSSSTSTTNTSTDTSIHDLGSDPQSPFVTLPSSNQQSEQIQTESQHSLSHNSTNISSNIDNNQESSSTSSNIHHARSERLENRPVFVLNVQINNSRGSNHAMSPNLNPIDHIHNTVPLTNNNPDRVFANFYARQRVYSMLLIRIALLYSVSVPKFLRCFIEYLVLLMAVICFALLIHMHIIFIRSPLTCLDHVKHTWPRNGIIRVEIGDSDRTPQPIKNFEIETPNKTYTKTGHIIYPMTYNQYFNHIYKFAINEREAFSLNDSIKKDDHRDESTLDDPIFKLNTVWPDPYIIEYSLEYGLLRLSETMREHYKVPVMRVILNPVKDKCFGDSMAKFMLHNFLGYDDVLIGSIKQLAENENNKGFVRNVVTGEHFRFVNVWMTRTSYLAAAFIMFIFTLFVSMLIRYSHQQVFVFVSEFLRSLELQQPARRISFLGVSLITVILALIGMETIMYEFFSDSSITFHIIIMVWVADHFDSLAVQSRITRRYFLRFFYLYQFVFYAYHYRFNGQYSGLALLTTMLFTYHSMIYFFHHFELPLLRAAFQHSQNRND